MGVYVFKKIVLYSLGFLFIFKEKVQELLITNDKKIEGVI